VAILIAGSSGVTVGRSAARERPAKDRLVGAWGLVSFVSFDANGASRPGAYDLGRIIYDASGQMSAHLMHSSNKADASPATDADRSAAFRRYLGYYGRLPSTNSPASSFITCSGRRTRAGWAAIRSGTTSSRRRATR
jgi:hypothetical protein